MTEEVRRPRVPTASKYHSALKSVIKPAIIVLDALGDSEMRFPPFAKPMRRFAAERMSTGAPSFGM